MNEDAEFGYKARQILNQGVDALDREVTGRLHEARQIALSRQRVPVRGLQIAGIGQELGIRFFFARPESSCRHSPDYRRNRHLLLECFRASP
jgi:hypothetical protein